MGSKDKRVVGRNVRDAQLQWVEDGRNGRDGGNGELGDGSSHSAGAGQIKRESSSSIADETGVSLRAESVGEGCGDFRMALTHQRWMMRIAVGSPPCGREVWLVELNVRQDARSGLLKLHDRSRQSTEQPQFDCTLTLAIL
jgi:hypothetical protein